MVMSFSNLGGFNRITTVSGLQYHTHPESVSGSKRLLYSLEAFIAAGMRVSTACLF